MRNLGEKGERLGGERRCFGTAASACGQRSVDRSSVRCGPVNVDVKLYIHCRSIT